MSPVIRMQSLANILIGRCFPVWNSKPSKECNTCSERKSVEDFYWIESAHGVKYRANRCKRCTIARVMAKRRAA